MVSYRVDDMTCGGCAGRINRALKQLDYRAEVGISVSERLVRVQSKEATETELAAAIREEAKVWQTVIRERGLAPK